MAGIAPNTKKLQVIKILIVEDEYILATNLQENLESLGYLVLDIADSAQAAIEKASELLPNLILMDIRLKGDRDGIQAAEEIWNSLKIPIIYVTGHSDRSTVERATLTLPFGYILKPVKEQELQVAIQTALNCYEREQFLSSVLREMGDGVIVVDAQLQIKYVNRVGETLTGWQFVDAQDQTLTKIFPLIDEQTLQSVQNQIIAAIQQHNTVYLGDRTLLIAKDGTMIPITGSATPLKENYGVITGAVIVFRDDTQKRLLEERNLANERTEQIAEQMVELQRLNQLKEDFLTVTSHEMRTPLSNIKMAISMLENVLNQQDILSSTTSSIPESVSRYLGILRYECERELNMVDDLLNMRIIDAANYPLELTSIPLQHWLPKIVNSFQKIAQVQKQVLEVSISSYLPPLVSDLNLVTRIVSELLMNACKYTPARERITVTLNLSQTPKTFKEQDHEFALKHESLSPCFQLKINNSGIEIPLADQSRIFEPFYRLPQSKTQEQLSIFEKSHLIPHSDSRQASGTGLGLTLVKKIVEYLQGTIEVTSSYGLTSFTVELPLTFSVKK